METICALASAPGRAGVAVIRVSGPDAFAAGRALAGSLPDPGRHALRVLRDADGAVLDQALVLAFEGPHSFTGEDVVELQVHGSIAVIRAVLAALLLLPGVRPAEAGEFTKRALQNNRMGLTQVEGLGDLIDAETEAQRRQALQVTQGGLAEAVDTLRSDLVRASALMEATIDFVDEDVPVDVGPEVIALVDAAEAALTRLAQGVPAAERIRTGFEVALIGPPNAGKSTLLNHLAGREAAITSEIAGTTRDVIEVRMDVAGLPVTLLDTAGLRDSADEIEAKGVALTQKRAYAADLRIFLMTGDAIPVTPKPGDLVLTAKDDTGAHSVGISGKTGAGADRLMQSLSDALSGRVADAGLASNARHAGALASALEALAVARPLIDLGPEHYDIVAEEVRSAVRALEELVGRIDVEDLLDDIFSSFCIGK